MDHFVIELHIIIPLLLVTGVSVSWNKMQFHSTFALATIVRMSCLSLAHIQSFFPLPVGSGPWSSSRARSVSMHSWMMYRALSWVGSWGSGCPYGAKTSWSLTTFSWCSRWVIFTSRRACFTVTASRITSFLMATRCPLRWSTADKTRPVTPVPRGRGSTKWPLSSKPPRKGAVLWLAITSQCGWMVDW